MRRGEFEDILEECLSALLEGRRDIKESLSLYPAWSRQLEPLLKTAQEIAAGLDQTPSGYAKERGLHRILEAARAKRRLRQLIPYQPKAAPWSRWAPAAAAAVAAIGALSFMSATLFAEDGYRLGDQVSVMPYAPPPQHTVPAPPPQTPLERVQEEVAELEGTVRDGETVDLASLEALEDASGDLASDLDSPRGLDLIERAAAASIVTQQRQLLQTVQDESDGTQASAAAAGLAAADIVLVKLGIPPTPTPEPTPTPTGVAAPSPEPTPTPTTESPSPPAPTPTPSP